MFLVPIDQIEQLLAHAHAALPREASGMLAQRVADRFAVLSVVGASSDENSLRSFRIRDSFIETVEKSLRGSGTTICGCFHSHVLGSAYPSKLDSAGPKKQGELWLIYSVRFRQLHLFEWNGVAFRRRRFLIAPSLGMSAGVKSPLIAENVRRLGRKKTPDSRRGAGDRKKNPALMTTKSKVPCRVTGTRRLP